MMGDRNYRGLIESAIESIGRELDPNVDAKDIKTIHIHEVVRCLRRSYYDRVDPKNIERTGFNDLVSGLLRNMQYGAKSGEFDLQDLKLKGRPDMIIDDAVIIFRSANELPELPHADDVLYLNACMFIFNKIDGVVIYLTGDRKEVSFSLSKNNKMFEEVVRRVRVLNDLLKEQKVPILEPSVECMTCQYYDRCYINKRIGRPIGIRELVGMGKE